MPDSRSILCKPTKLGIPASIGVSLAKIAVIAEITRGSGSRKQEVRRTENDCRKYRKYRKYRKFGARHEGAGEPRSARP